MTDTAIIFGYSGHAYMIAELLLLNGYKIIGYCDNEEKSSNPYNLTYLGSETNTHVIKALKEHAVFLGTGNNMIRKNIFKFLTERGINCPSIAHPTAIISATAKIGNATVIMPGAIINAYATLGYGVICNSGSVVEHECFIDNFVHIAPGAVLAGNVNIGENSFVGANAVVKQGVNIGKNVIVGAGSVVLNHIADNLIVYGNPAN